MRRHPALRDLSSDHHQSLVQSHRLQKWPHADAAARQKIVADFLNFWMQEGQRHFCEEEQALLPYFARWGNLDQEPIQQMLREHVLIRRNTQILKEDAAQPEEFFTSAGKLLEGHVRLEERVVFPLIEQELPEHALDALPAALALWQNETIAPQKTQAERTIPTEKSQTAVNIRAA